MMPLNPSRLFLACAVVDMRKSYDGLVSLVVGQLDSDPLQGDAYVFVGRDRRRLKILVWDGDGLWIYMKRLTKGRFVLPHPALDRCACSVARFDPTAAAGWSADAVYDRWFTLRGTLTGSALGALSQRQVEAARRGLRWLANRCGLFPASDAAA